MGGEEDVWGTGECVGGRKCITARSQEDETRNGHRNANRNPRWSSLVSFRRAHLKRDMNFDHRGFTFAFRRAFRVSSSRERAVGCRRKEDVWGEGECINTNMRPVASVSLFSRSPSLERSPSL